VFADLPLQSPVARVACVCLLMTFLTEITSNTATTLVMLPILAEAAPSMGLHPMALMIPATVSASCAFMLPVATPPNAIVFASGHVSMARMIRSGILLNLIGIVLVTTVIYGWVLWRLGIDPNTVPTWVK
jgi:sodium-dependent dicarboxylate transporter 2/3/5